METTDEQGTRRWSSCKEIGLRRALCRLIHETESVTTVTIHDEYTSSYDPETLRPVAEARGVHALLRDEDVYQTRGCYWLRGAGSPRSPERASLA
jgi:hypothetical protein